MPTDTVLLLEEPRASVVHLSLALRRQPEAIAIARAAVTAWAWELAGGGPRLDALQLLVSEAVTNAVIREQAASDGAVLLRASWSEGCVRVIVTATGTVEGPAVGGDEIGGYGPAMVDKVALAWGEQEAEGETSVWFEV
jgi:anti-sigma regulatory factor (Ser/Thr protein kinase)